MSTPPYDAPFFYYEKTFVLHEINLLYLAQNCAELNHTIDNCLSSSSHTWIKVKSKRKIPIMTKFVDKTS